mgnify:CR=1 FL=1
MPYKFNEKLRYTIMKATVTVPTHLSEITLRQYQEFLSAQDKIKNTHILQCKMIEIFCYVTPADALAIKATDADRIVEKLTKVLNQKPKLVSSFKLGKIEFGFHPDIEDMTLGEYIDLDTHIGEWETIQAAMNVLYRPIKIRKAGKYKINDYNPDSKEAMLQMPLDAVISSVFFLLNLGLDLSVAMSHYLQEQEEKPQVQEQDLHNVGDGIKVFTDSLTEILQSLKISQN